MDAQYWYENSHGKYRHLIGKKVSLTCQNETWVGIVDYIGFNTLHKQFQVTLDRTPLWPVDPKSIKLL